MTHIKSHCLRYLNDNVISYYDTEVIPVFTCTELVSECKVVILKNTDIF